MNVREFFELSAGKWFSQKTSHHLTLKQSEHGKTDLVIEILPNDNPHVIQLCQQVGIDPSLTWGGAKYTWKGTVSWDTQPQNPANQQGETIVVSIPDLPAAHTGRLFRADNGTTPQVAQYQMGDDDALTLVTKQESICFEERIWFESDNVRLRTTMIAQANGDSLASFYSEIRMGGK
ncbi:phycobiliprotein lyase [Chamaesiphon sp. VAR_48_metabat_135_sub]|uniref:phycobiliprotein lyase n=1 Tax=Chamaesiphon sp. VAR_48_metabat_135_sub TaxID=2964699 RepID=UPI00286A6D3D|nr:phycobiliprotein lyase [Chamaesiphon sp. VAR_48_metabat_135_sub]